MPRLTSVSIQRPNFLLAGIAKRSCLCEYCFRALDVTLCLFTTLSGTACFWVTAFAVTFTLPYLFDADKANLGPMIGFVRLSLRKQRHLTHRTIYRSMAPDASSHLSLFTTASQKLLVGRWKRSSERSLFCRNYLSLTDKRQLYDGGGSTDTAMEGL